MQDANMIQAQGNAYSGLNNSQNAANAVPLSASDSIVSRLNRIREAMADSRSSVCNAADKIVGSAPTPIQGAATGQIIKGERPPASCFLDAVQQVLTDIEQNCAETQDHINRLHCSF